MMMPKRAERPKPEPLFEPVEPWRYVVGIPLLLFGAWWFLRAVGDIGAALGW